jgi:regulator of nucleoside diphosphate kinase
VNGARYLTVEESRLLSRTAERLLRLADVELNLGEHVLKVLRQATLRQTGCRREDIASINSTVKIQMLGCSDQLEFTLVCPRDADPASRRVSILTPLGLSFLGRAVGAVVRVPLASGYSRFASLVEVWECARLPLHSDSEEACDLC